MTDLDLILALGNELRTQVGAYSKPPRSVEDLLNEVHRAVERRIAAETTQFSSEMASVIRKTVMERCPCTECRR